MYNNCQIILHFLPMKTLSLILRILLGLLLLLPVAGTAGMMPPPTADMYSTPGAWNYMSALMEVGFMMPMIGILCFVCAMLFFMNRTALGAALLAPFTVNVIAFHLFLDAALISAEAIPAYILVILNAYFLWINREKYAPMWS